MSETLDPSDLLDENGNVDGDKVRARQTKGRATNPEVTSETCAEWRRALHGEPNAEAVAADTEYLPKSVARHARGDCCCDTDETPVEYRRNYETFGGGEWRAVDE